VSPGVDGRLGTRNAPSLANVAYHPYYLREGGLPTLEMQVFVPLQETHEMDFEIALAAARLAQDSTYQAMSASAYGRPMDPYVITRALSTFERTLISGDSRYDRHLRGADQTILSPSEKAGMDLFFSERTNCSACHGGYNFTTYTFSNNGLYTDYADPGRFRLTSQERDRALFKTPSLRNVSITAPYMHDGSLATLRDVIDHYDSGGQAHPNKSPLIRPLNLTNSEKDALVAFLQMLIDPTFIHNPHLRPE
jgi:cytochrome c peroxidase